MCGTRKDKFMLQAKVGELRNSMKTLLLQNQQLKQDLKQSRLRKVRMSSRLPHHSSQPTGSRPPPSVDYAISSNLLLTATYLALCLLPPAKTDTFTSLLSFGKSKGKSG